MITNTTGEGLAVFSAGVDALPAWSLALFPTMVLKLGLLAKAGFRPQRAGHIRARGGMVLAILLVLCTILTNGFVRPFERLWERYSGRYNGSTCSL